jgi:hypothetical protein
VQLLCVCGGGGPVTRWGEVTAASLNCTMGGGNVASSRSQLPVPTLRSVGRVLVTANVVLSSPILVTLMLQALSSSETSILSRVTRRNIPEDGILHSHRRENLKSYIALTGWALTET